MYTKEKFAFAPALGIAWMTPGNVNKYVDGFKKHKKRVWQHVWQQLSHQIILHVCAVHAKFRAGPRVKFTEFCTFTVDHLTIGFGTISIGFGPTFRT